MGSTVLDKVSETFCFPTALYFVSGRGRIRRNILQNCKVRLNIFGQSGFLRLSLDWRRPILAMPCPSYLPFYSRLTKKKSQLSLSVVLPHWRSQRGFGHKVVKIAANMKPLQNALMQISLGGEFWSSICYRRPLNCIGLASFLLGDGGHHTTIRIGPHHPHPHPQSSSS